MAITLTPLNTSTDTFLLWKTKINYAITHLNTLQWATNDDIINGTPETIPDSSQVKASIATMESNLNTNITDMESRLTANVTEQANTTTTAAIVYAIVLS